METIHSTSRFSWGYELTPGFRTVPPTPDELQPVLDPEGNPVLDGEGNPIQVPKETWQPQTEQIELDTVVVVEATDNANATVFKISFDKEGLGRFVAHYIEHLDADGRNLVREALGNTSDIVIPQPSLSKGALKLVP